MSEAMEKAAASKAAASEKTSKLGQVNTSGGFGAGAGGGFGLNKPGFGPEVKHFAKATGQVIDVDPKVHEAWLRVMDDAHSDGFVVCEYSADGKTINLKACGEGGLKEFKKELPDNALGWGGFRCWGVDKRGGTECKRTKFVFVQWMCEGVSQIKKAKMGSHKGAMKCSMDGAHLDILCETLLDFDEKGLIKKMQAATGAHKPNGYEFEHGVFIEDDYYGLGIGKDCKGETSTGEKVAPIEEHRVADQRRASNAADMEQMRRIAEDQQIAHDAKVERQENQQAALDAMDAEQARRVSESGVEPKRASLAISPEDLAGKAIPDS